MTMTCPQCDGPVRIYDTNGAEYPEALIEHARCQDCGKEFTNVLTVGNDP